MCHSTYIWILINLCESWEVTCVGHSRFANAQTRVEKTQWQRRWSQKEAEKIQFKHKKTLFYCEDA